MFQLLVQMFSLIMCHGNVARPFDEYLNVVFPSDFCQFAQSFQFGELCGIVGIGNGTWTQAVSQ